MLVLGLLLLMGMAVIGYEAITSLGSVGTAVAASAPAGAGTTPAGSGSSVTGLPEHGPGFTTTQIAQAAARAGFDPNGQAKALFLANRESGNGTNFGPACCGVPHTSICPAGTPIADGWAICTQLGNEPHYGIYQWGRDAWSQVWNEVGCLGNLDCEMKWLFKATGGGKDWSPWAL